MRSGRAAGTTSSRSVRIACSDTSSAPVPLMPILIFATVFAGLTATAKGSLASPVARARRLKSSILAVNAGVVTSAASATTTAGSLPPGNALSIRLNVSAIW